MEETYKVLDERLVDSLTERIVLLAETMGEFTLYPYQRTPSERVIRSLLKVEGATVTELFARQTGKTTMNAAIAAVCMLILPKLAVEFPEELGIYKEGLKVGVFAPVSEQAYTLFDRVHNTLTTESSLSIITGPDFRMKVPAKFGTRGNAITLDNGSVCRLHSANLHSQIESKTYNLVLLDECQQISSYKVMKSILPMCSAVNGTVIASGTPDIYIGYFYDQINQNKRHDNSTKTRKKDNLHYEYDYIIGQKYNQYYKKFVDKEKRRLGEDGDEFKMSYRLIWPIEKGMMFERDLLKEKCYDKESSIVNTDKTHRCIAGLDFGKSKDSTVLTILRVGQPDEEGNVTKTVLDWLELEGDTWEEQIPKLVDKIEKYSIDTLVADASGLGDPLVERLTVMLPDIEVVPFVFSNKSKDTGYKYLLQEITAGRVKVPAKQQTKKLQKFEYQMTTLKKHYVGQLLSPRPIDDDKGHDDMADSIMLGVYATYIDAISEIELVDMSFYTDRRKKLVKRR